ncbi:hypothetical protein MNBD_GAMMA08-2199 [hydrothermal vent metagenome]|uniref:Uncharacterized protein n=1 Tax=hydrothermal vent metagenome TaxID=652676 RepID=A0A3B0XEZ4_9ZZZZ
MTKRILLIDDQAPDSALLSESEALEFYKKI